MKTTFTSLILLFIFLCQAQGLKNLIGTDIQKCINCFCHARTGCFSRINCARYSISKSYWLTADSPVVDANHDPDADSSYTACMNDENCILNTIAQYTERHHNLDCNCDGTFDCKDRFAIHMHDLQCSDPLDPEQLRRFNTCAAQAGVGSMTNADNNCVPEVF